MEITSKGLQSDFIFHKRDGVITDLGDCISVLTPNNQTFYFGNFLLFPNPPAIGDIVKWRSRFAEVFANYPDIQHETFQWLPNGTADLSALKKFKETGFTVNETTVLAAKSVHLEKQAPEGVEFRKIRTDEEWLSVVDAQSSNVFSGSTYEKHRHYKEAAFKNIRNMAEAGLGDWWGAYKGDELVADMGLFFGDGVGRFQSVETAEKHRRQGICRAMVHHVSQDGFSKYPGITLMLHADAHEIAREIYMSVGYKEIETLTSVFKPPSQAN